MKRIDDHLYYTTTEAAAMISVSPSTLRKIIGGEWLKKHKVYPSQGDVKLTSGGYKYLKVTFINAIEKAYWGGVID